MLSEGGYQRITKFRRFQNRGVLDEQGKGKTLSAMESLGRSPLLNNTVSFSSGTDIITAMADALMGELHNAAWIPTRRYDNIENSPHGRGEIVALAPRHADLGIR